MARPPIGKASVYNQQLPGVFGEFGSARGLQAFYLQSAIEPRDLDRISLISDIPGSEEWPVRDLFQRDVDKERVTNSLLPYLQKQDKIKFFNPLTLTVLPMDENGDSVSKELTLLEENEFSNDTGDWMSLERNPYFRMRWLSGHYEYAMLDWNDKRSRMVAIDGQHRLFALKCMKADQEAAESYAQFMNWRIPVVIVSFRVSADRKKPPTVLELVRNIFVYINTTASKVNREREILLSDESVNDVATQELLDYSHSNDLLPYSKRDNGRIPLLAFDWRGEEQGGDRVSAPSALKSITELNDWYIYYILGHDWSECQELTLGVNPTDPLKRAFHNKHLTHADSELLRKRLSETVLPGITYLLENFQPYAEYISELRKLEESEMRSDSHISRHAFEQLRFGANKAPDILQTEIQDYTNGLQDQILELKDRILIPPISEDIGMRGIVWAYAELPYDLSFPDDWTEYSKWFVNALNEAYKERWIDRTRGAIGHKHLKHIVEDHSERVVNYRLEDAENALGPFVALLIDAYATSIPEKWVDDWNELKEHYIEILRDTLTRGYKKEFRPELREKFPQGGRELTDAVKVKAERAARTHIRGLERALTTIREQHRKK